MDERGFSIGGRDFYPVRLFHYFASLSLSEVDSDVPTSAVVMRGMVYTPSNGR
jgi:hypothetical protein